jgi:hypothetical protein
MAAVEVLELMGAGMVEPGLPMVTMLQLAQAVVEAVQVLV